MVLCNTQVLLMKFLYHYFLRHESRHVFIVQYNLSCVRIYVNLTQNCQVVINKMSISEVEFTSCVLHCYVYPRLLHCYHVYLRSQNFGIETQHETYFFAKYIQLYFAYFKLVSEKTHISEISLGVICNFWEVSRQAVFIGSNSFLLLICLNYSLLKR